jgi:hypothetical protein
LCKKKKKKKKHVGSCHCVHAYLIAIKIPNMSYIHWRDPQRGFLGIGAPVSQLKTRKIIRIESPTTGMQMEQ